MDAQTIQDAPPLLRYLNDELSCAVQPVGLLRGHQVFTADLSSLRLRLSHRNPVIVVSEQDADGLAPRQLYESVQDVLRELANRLGQDSRTGLVLLGSRSAKASRGLQRQLPKTANNLVLIGAQQQDDILASRSPTGALLDLIVEYISVSRLSPYETNMPVTGSRFFGRDNEVHRILENTDSSYMLLGIRRVGKTSVLKEVLRRLKDVDPEYPAYYIECSDFNSPLDYMDEVIRRLDLREYRHFREGNAQFRFPQFLDRMHRRHKRRLVFLLDEVDNLIVRQRGQWDLFRMLRASWNSGACRYIMAGFREAMAVQTSQDSPFYNFAEPLRLGEFTRQQASDLITHPMESLRIRIKDRDAVVSRIYDETSGQPNLMQYYCTILLRNLDETSDRQVSQANLIDVYKDEGFKEHLLSTFMSNTNSPEKAVVYVVLMGVKRRDGADMSQLRFTEAHIDRLLKGEGVQLSQEDISKACRSLVLAGVLTPQDRHYKFSSPVFPRVLRENSDIGYLFSKVKEAGI